MEHAASHIQDSRDFPFPFLGGIKLSHFINVYSGSRIIQNNLPEKVELEKNLERGSSTPLASVLKEDTRKHNQVVSPVRSAQAASIRRVFLAWFFPRTER
jgi:hypothetical protein